MVLGAERQRVHETVSRFPEWVRQARGVKRERNQGRQRSGGGTGLWGGFATSSKDAVAGERWTWTPNVGS